MSNGKLVQNTLQQMPLHKDWNHWLLVKQESSQEQLLIGLHPFKFWVIQYIRWSLEFFLQRNAFIRSQLPILLKQSTIVMRCKDTMYYVWHIRAVHFWAVLSWSCSPAGPSRTTNIWSRLVVWGLTWIVVASYKKHRTQKSKQLDPVWGTVPARLSWPNLLHADSPMGVSAGWRK